MKMNFTEHDVTAMHAELSATRERVHKPILVRGIAASHRRDQMNYLRQQEKLAAWRRTNGLDRSEVLAERQRRILRYVCLVDDPEYSKSKYMLNRGGHPPLNNFTESMWAEVNRLRQELSPPQPPMLNVLPRRSSARSPPEKPCSVSRVLTDIRTEKPEISDKDKRGEIPLLVHVCEDENIQCKMRSERIAL